MSEALDSDSPILSRAESFSDFLEGFKSARMSFEPLENWLFGPKSKNRNGDELDATSRLGETRVNHCEDIESCQTSHEMDEDSDDDEFDAKASHNSDSEDEIVQEYDDKEDDKAPYHSDDDSSELCDDGEHVDDSVEEDLCDDICHFNDSFDECCDEETNKSPWQMTSNDGASQLSSDNCSASETLDHHSIGKNDLPANEFENVVYRRRKLTHNKPGCDSFQAGFYKTNQLNLLPSYTDEYPTTCFTNMPSSDSGYRAGEVLQPSQNHCDITILQIQKFHYVDTRAVLRNKSNDEEKLVTGEFTTAKLSSEKASSGVLELDKMAKRVRMRNMITQEILDTEKTYHRHLELIVKVQFFYICFL